MNVDFLKNYLIQKKISIYRLSKISGIGDGRLNQIINKKTKKPQMTTVVKIAKALDLTNDEFAELLIKKNKLPQIHETNNIPNVITKMFGRKFRILNENDIAYCRSQSVYATKLDLVRDCMWIGRYEQYGSNEEINRPLYAMVEKKHNSGAAIYGDFIITNFNFTSLTNEQVKYYNYFFGKRSIDDANKLIIEYRKLFNC